MKEEFLKELADSREVHRMLPINEEETNTYRLERKPVLENRVIDDMQDVSRWQSMTEYVTISSSDEVLFEGKKTMKLDMPTNLEDWLPERDRGRIFAEPGAFFPLNRENLEEWNRMSLWVYPAPTAMKSVTVRLQLHNDGEKKVPDKYVRAGHHNAAVKPGQWNHITCEIPLLYRDCVTGFSVEYDMCGHENDTEPRMVWYLGKLEIQKVEADVEEGWVPGEEVIAISASGYLPEAPKTAVIGKKFADSFRLVETGTGRTVFTGPVKEVKIKDDALYVMDFSKVTGEGDYLLMVGDRNSRTISIAKDVWIPSCWRVLNFMLSQRCGMPVKGKHRACHTDLRLVHGDLSIIANGGWHDAADLAQALHNTADGTAGLFLLADVIKDTDPRLYERVLEEAQWGLDYVMKTRFPDGFRANYSSTSIWTDGIIGNKDDITMNASESPFVCFSSAYAEALGAYTLREEDPSLSAWALKTAKADFDAAAKQYERSVSGDPSIKPDLCEVQIFGAAAAAAGALIRAGAIEYAEAAAGWAEKLIECQQTEWTGWEKPLIGFYYIDRKHTIPWHHNHLSYEQFTTAGLELLLSCLPDHPEASLWRAAMERTGLYYKTITAYTDPWNLIPEGVYYAGEVEKAEGSLKRMLTRGFPEDAHRYRTQVENGFCLDKEKEVYLRVFPVWFSFRGNLNVQLSEAIACASAARITGDRELMDIARRQMEWTTGFNPFGQSLIYGEGYNWTDEYTVQPGRTIGQMPVGIQSFEDLDRPWWPQVQTATYKEVWICPATKWFWLMSYMGE